MTERVRSSYGAYLPGLNHCLKASDFVSALGASNYLQFEHNKTMAAPAPPPGGVLKSGTPSYRIDRYVKKASFRRLYVAGVESKESRAEPSTIRLVALTRYVWEENNRPCARPYTVLVARTFATSRGAPAEVRRFSARVNAISALESSPMVAAAMPRLNAASTRSLEPLDARSISSNSVKARPDREALRCTNPCNARK